MRRRIAFICLLLAPALLPLAAEKHGHAADAQTSHLTLWKLANFVLFAGAIGYVLRKKAGGFFRARSEEIREGIREAARLKGEAEAHYAAIEERLAGLGPEVERLRARAREEAAAEQARVRAELERALNNIRAEAEREIAAAAKAARQQLRSHAAELATGLAAAKIRQRFSPEVQATLVDAMVADLAKQPAGRPPARVF